MSGDELKQFLKGFRKNERDEARRKILFAQLCNWRGFYSWTEEESTAADLMGIDPEGNRRAVPDVEKETA